MEKNFNNLKKLIEIVEKLRAPDGCMWDREQTHYSLKENMIEEAYEAVEAIDNNNLKHLKEELGDVLLQVVLHSQIASENNNFNIDDVAKELSDKLIRRHPHVFGTEEVSSTAEIWENWEKIKKQEKPERESVLDGITEYLPSLLRAYKISKRAIKVGFEWPNVESLWECVMSELEEFKDAVKNNDETEMEDELGDILFSVVNLARWHKINPEMALLKANKKFMKRFKKMEEIAEKKLTEYSAEEFDTLWKKAKTLVD